MDDTSTKGIAMIVALLILLVTSTLGATVMYLTQSEITTTYNYKRLTQARYAAEAGVQTAIVSFPDLGATEPVERFTEVIAAFA